VDSMANICVIGTGYVGLVTGTCLADMGNRVTCVDIVEAKIALLKQGVLPIYEPGLQELVERNVRAGRLHFATSYKEGLASCEFIFIAVNTPMGTRSGGADMSYVESAALGIARELDHSALIINKSTVPVGTGDLVTRIIADNLAHPEISFTVVANPEFLREGSAVRDFLQPDRVVLGSSDGQAARQVASLYLSLRAPLVITDPYTAEMIKYASNAFLATKISFINEIARICERLGADVKEVAAGMGYDKRIGRAFLDAGLGYGGSCFPKDVRALASMSEEAGLHPRLLQAVMEINQDQRRLVVAKLVELLGSLRGCTIGILGLAFKPNTDDMREAPSIDLVRWMTGQGALIRAFDPVAKETARQALEREEIYLDLVSFCESAYETAAGADALVIATDWREFSLLDLAEVKSLMRRPVLIDGRNIYNAEELSRLGFTYRGIGRGTDAANLAMLMPLGQARAEQMSQQEPAVQPAQARR
jgi:UDPglucose 6-dehydrogenase